MHIDELFNTVRQQIGPESSQATLTVPANWSQGRTLYGGISASLVYCAMRETVEAPKWLRALNTSFIGPIEPDKPLTIEVKLLREGKNTTQMQGLIEQDGKVCLMSLASFGTNRSSKVKVENHNVHNMMLPQKGSFLPMIPKLTPKFLGHFEMTKSLGSWPFTGSRVADLHGWMRYKKAPQTFTDAHLVAIIDMWPPTVLQLLRWPAPASTMSWNLEFIHPHKTFRSDAWFAYQATTRQADGGYAHTEANVWDQEGKLIAISRQTVTVFD